MEINKILIISTIFYTIKSNIPTCNCMDNMDNLYCNDYANDLYNDSYNELAETLNTMEEKQSTADNTENCQYKDGIKVKLTTETNLTKLVADLNNSVNYMNEQINIMNNKNLDINTINSTAQNTSIINSCLLEYYDILSDCNTYSNNLKGLNFSQIIMSIKNLLWIMNTKINQIEEIQMSDNANKIRRNEKFYKYCKIDVCNEMLPKFYYLHRNVTKYIYNIMQRNDTINTNYKNNKNK